MKCRTCQTHNNPGAGNCRQCAAPLPPSCPACGAGVAAAGALCISCKTYRVPQVEAEDLFPDSGEVTAIATAPYELSSRFVGRTEALATLNRCFDDARSGSELRFATVVGEPGMGKSRLVRELAARVARAGAAMWCGDCDGRGQAFSPFARLFEQRFRIPPGARAEEVRGLVQAGVAEVLPSSQVTEVAHLFAHLMRVPFPRSPVVGPLVEHPHRLETRMFIAVRRFLRADALRAPLVLCLENLELCGQETINLLHYLVAGLRGSPVLVLGTARAHLFERYPSYGDGDVTMERIDLDRLDDAEATELMRELCRPVEGPVPERLLAQARKLRSSPRAIFELVRLMLEREIILRSGATTWRVDTARLERAELPDSHDSLIAARLAAMDPAERDALERGAVIGETFWLDAVVALIRLDESTTEDPDGPSLADIAAAGDRTRTGTARTMAKLIEREWLVEIAEPGARGEIEYRFAYPRLWKATYRRMDPTRRGRMHKMVAQWLELRPEGRKPRVQEDVAHHLELAGDASGAAARYRRAADAARKSFGNEKAVRLYSSALSCLGEADLASRIHLWHDLGSVYELKGDFEAAIGAFERMLRLSWLVASRTKAAVAFNKMGRVWRRKGDLKLALEYLERGADLFEQTHDDRGTAGSLDDIGNVLFLLGRYEEAYDKVTRGLAARGRGGNELAIAASLSTLGNIQHLRGRFDESRTCHTEALEIHERAGDRAGAVRSLNNLAVLSFETGDVDAARDGWKRALHEAEDIGALPLQSLALSNLGELALKLGNDDEARSRLEEALTIARDIDDRQLQVESLRNLALLEHRSGTTSRARELASDALRIARQSGLRDCEGRALIALAEIESGNLFDTDLDETTSRGQWASAEDYFSRGVSLLRDIGSESELARSLEAYGRYKIEQGDTAAGKHLLREALAVFTRLGMQRSAAVQDMLSAV